MRILDVSLQQHDAMHDPDHKATRDVVAIARHFISGRLICDFEVDCLLGEAEQDLLAQYIEVLRNGIREDIQFVKGRKITEDIASYAGLFYVINRDFGLKPDEIVPEDFDLSPEFIESLRQRIGSAKHAIEALYNIKQIPRFREHWQPFLTKVQNLMNNKDLAGVFQLIEENLGSNDLLIGEGEETMAYFLLCLPREIRIAVHHLIYANTVLKTIEIEQSAITTDQQHEYFELLKAWYMQQPLMHHHWIELMEEYDLGTLNGEQEEKMTVKRQRLDELSLAMANFNDPNKRKVVEGIEKKIKNSIENLLDGLRDFWYQRIASTFPVESYTGTEVEQFQQQKERAMLEGCAMTQSVMASKFCLRTDMGHGIDFYFYLLQKLWMAEGIGGKEKAGDGKAVVLEDDHGHMECWRRIIGMHPTYSTASQTEQSLFFNDAGLLESVMDDHGFFNLYLLDIQNGDDDTAGIRIAESVIRKYFKKYRQILKNGIRAEVPCVKVIVFSSSFDLVQRGRERLDKYRDLRPGLVVKVMHKSEFGIGSL